MHSISPSLSVPFYRNETFQVKMCLILRVSNLDFSNKFTCTSSAVQTKEKNNCLVQGTLVFPTPPAVPYHLLPVYINLQQPDHTKNTVFLLYLHCILAWARLIFYNFLIFKSRYSYIISKIPNTPFVKIRRLVNSLTHMQMYLKIFIFNFFIIVILHFCFQRSVCQISYLRHNFSQGRYI